jgi:hypothetical protein
MYQYYPNLGCSLALPRDRHGDPDRGRHEVHRGPVGGACFVLPGRDAPVETSRSSHATYVYPLR